MKRHVVTLATGTLLGMAANASAQATRDSLLVTAQVYGGWRYFQVHCARCHGEDAKGNMLAPDLTWSVRPDSGITADSFMVVVRLGSAGQTQAPDRRMRGFDDMLEDDQVAAIYAYVIERRDGRLAPGRPHRAPAPSDAGQ